MNSRTPLLVAVFATFILVSSGAFAASWDNVSIGAVPDIDLGSLDKDDVPDTIFMELVENRAELTHGHAVYLVNNIFNVDIPLTTDFYELSTNDITEMTYYIQVNETYEVKTPIYETQEECFNDTNGSWCTYEDVVIGQDTSTESREVWTEMTKYGDLVFIPAHYNGLIKIRGDYAAPAFGNPVHVDWVPKTKLDTGWLDWGGTEFAQKEWAWWDASWSARKNVTFTSTNATNAVNEILYVFIWNDSDYNASLGYPYDLRVVTSNTEQPYEIFNYSTGGTQAIRWIGDANTTGSTYEIYYNNAVAPFPKYSDCATWSPCWEDNSTRSFFVEWQNFENNSNDSWSSGGANMIITTVTNVTYSSGGGTYAAYAYGNGDEIGVDLLFEDANATQLFFGMHKNIRETNKRTTVNLNDGGAYANSANIRYRYDVGNGIRSYNGAWLQLDGDEQTDWYTLNMHCGSGVGNCNLSEENATVGLYHNVTLDIIRGTVNAYDRLSLDDPVNGAGNLGMYVDNIYISTQNRFLLRPEPSTYVLAAAESNAATGWVGVNQTEFDPANASQYTAGLAYNFNATICHHASLSVTRSVNFTFNGTVYAPTNTSVNATCSEFNWSRVGLPVGDFVFNWTASTNDSQTAFSVGSYNVSLNRTNNVTVAITPSTSVSPGTSITATCSDDVSGSLVMNRDGIGISNPYTAALAAGSYVFNCTATQTNYTTNTTSTTLTVTSATGGCFNNETYAYRMQLNVTNNKRTVLDFWNYRNNSLMRPDLQDVTVQGLNATVMFINASRFVVINTSGLLNENITILWGNYLQNNSYTVNAVGGDTSTDALVVSTWNESVLLTFRDEKNLSEMRPRNANVTLDFFCTSGHSSYTLYNQSVTAATANWTRFHASTSEKWEKVSATVTYGVGDYYKRHLTMSNPYVEDTMWLPDAKSYTVREVVNQKVDLSGDFDTANLTVRKWINDTLETVDIQFFDAAQLAFFYGVDGDEYQYIVSNGDDTRTLGNVVVDAADLSKVITIRPIDYRGLEQFGRLAWNYTYNETSGLLRYSYSDPYNNTSEINMTVSYDTNGSQLYFTQAFNVVNTTFSYTVPANRRADDFRVRVMVNHQVDIGAFAISFLIGTAGVVTGLGATIGYFWTRIFAMGAYFIVILSGGKRHAHWMALFGGIILMVFSALEWLPLHPALLGAYFILTIVWIWQKGVRDKL